MTVKPVVARYHATTVAVDGAAVMITGPSGSGKSALALELIGLGALLVADDLSQIVMQDDAPVVIAPPELPGVIEARGVGLINVPHCPEAQLKLVVDMGQIEMSRLPTSPAITEVNGCAIECLFRVDAPYFAIAIFNLLRHGRHAPAE
ncbi:Hpr(Ser) kinase/phosphatase [Aliiroseovarius halocynthiae]|uniref:Serine kinase n=1 Tax=Aliiroseovarius halocynthiae TaxID=985055 RepID=A0A545SN08_9RHOB|nr:serine kinase [Aliiroseovarius halocynthiae]TQV66341.1 serine kinase [Aliiroseovarius halocynthiae]SMR83313.1 Hpr(Ser) kinase/phosphatase [Aliiroseovarius halocynthiae]